MTEFINNEIFENFNFRKLNDILNKREDLNEYERKKFFFFIININIFNFYNNNNCSFINKEKNY